MIARDTITHSHLTNCANCFAPTTEALDFRGRPVTLERASSRPIWIVDPYDKRAGLFLDDNDLSVKAAYEVLPMLATSSGRPVHQCPGRKQ